MGGALSADWLVAFGYLASTFNVVSAFMHTMIPLRLFALATNACFIIYGAAIGAYPIVISHAILLPVNLVRLHQMITLSRQVEAASGGDIDPRWLMKFGRLQTVSAGAVVFSKGDPADHLYFAVNGEFVLEESGIVLAQGQIVGELGLFSEANRRTQTLICRRDGQLLRISYPEIKQLYYQNARFGFFFLNLVSRRLFHNIAAAEARAEMLRKERTADQEAQTGAAG